MTLIIVSLPIINWRLAICKTFRALLIHNFLHNVEIDVNVMRGLKQIKDNVGCLF